MKTNQTSVSLENYVDLGYDNKLAKVSDSSEGYDSSVFDESSGTLNNDTVLEQGSGGSGDSADTNDETTGFVSVDKLLSGQFSFGEFVVNENGRIRSGQTYFDNGIGWWIGDEDNVKKFSIGDSSGNKMTWDGATLTVVGSVTATTGSIGGWDIGSSYISSTGIKLSSGASANISFGNTPPTSAVSGTGIFIDKTGLYGLQANTQNFKIDATDGSITAQKGTIGGWNINTNTLSSGATEASSNVLIDSANSAIRLGPTSGNYITIDGANQRIRSSNYVAGVNGSGFSLDSNLLEVGNISARGLIRSAVFQKDAISSINGSVNINLGADVLDTDMTALDASTLTTKGEITLAVGDILRIRENSFDEWLEVTNIASAPTYVVTRDKAGSYTADNNPAWKKGATIVNYGQSGQGFIEQITNVANSPYIRIATHAGSPWSTTDTKVLIGQLQDKTGNNEYGLWIKSGASYIAGMRSYSVIVSQDGLGDFSDIQDAIDSIPTGGTIFIRNGMYEITSTILIDALTNITLIGEDVNNTIIKAGDGTDIDVFNVFNNSSYINFYNLQIDGNYLNQDPASFLKGIKFDFTNFVTIGNCYIRRNSAWGIEVNTGSGDIEIYDCIIEENVETGLRADTANRINVRNTLIYNNGIGVYTYESSGNFFISNTFLSNLLQNFLSDVATGVNISNTIISNYFYGNTEPDIEIMDTGCIVSNNVIGSAGIGVYMTSVSDCLITGNLFENHLNKAVYMVTATGCLVSDNMFVNNATALYDSINLTSNSANNIITNNIINASSSPSRSGIYTNSQLGNYISNNTLIGTFGTAPIISVYEKDTILNNIPSIPTQDRKLSYLKNTSGSTLSAGHIVVLKSVAAGNEVTTTTTQGDDKVYGMAVESITNNSFGLILTLGKTALMKVNGTTDIAIGDFIGTFTTAGIGMKAAAGDMAIAVALEAYTGNDSNGVIDALLITPRKI